MQLKLSPPPKKKEFKKSFLFFLRKIVLNLNNKNILMCPAKCFIMLPKYLMCNSFEIDFSM